MQDFVCAGGEVCPPVWIPFKDRDAPPHLQPLSIRLGWVVAARTFACPRGWSASYEGDLRGAGVVLTFGSYIFNTKLCGQAIQKGSSQALRVEFLRLI